MSTPGNEEPEAVVEKKRGLSKYVSRMKSVLRRSDGSKRLSFSSRTPVVATASTSTAPSAPLAPTEVPAPVEAITQLDTPSAQLEITPNPGGPQPTKVKCSQIDADRAQKLGERFKVPIEPNAWTAARAEKETYRVEKPIRMRIHRTCHQCNTTFGGNRTCTSCQHDRCSQCPRYPPKKDKTKGKRKEIEAISGVGIGIEVDTYYDLGEQIILTIPSRTGGQPLVRKKPTQRVRRTCHQCSTMFVSGNKICASCHHVRCADCPRDPAKRRKYPDGYPGDEHSATSTSPIKYDCHHCMKTFPPVPHPNSPEGLALGNTIEPLECTRCGHNRCPECERAPPRKVEPEPDPEVVRSVEARLAELNLSSAET